MEKPRTDCLVDTPDLDRLVGGPVCGNGFLERGEQCDCGRPEVQSQTPPPSAVCACGPSLPLQAGHLFLTPGCPAHSQPRFPKRPAGLLGRSDRSSRSGGGGPGVQPTQTFAVAPAPRTVRIAAATPAHASWPRGPSAPTAPAATSAG